MAGEKEKIVPTVWDRFDKLESQIAELRESDLEQEEHIQRLEGCVSDCQEEINEMKESLNEVAQNRIGWEKNIENNYRELLKKYSECEDSTIHKNFFLKLLKKLDSNKETDPSFETKGYISLKLSRKVDLNKLHSNIHRITQNHEIIKRWNEVTWKDVAEGLLKSDGSWEIRPEFYHKYDITKHKEVESKKEFEFQLVEKFIPPRNIRCKDCMNNPIPELISKFIQALKEPHSREGLIEKYMEMVNK